MKELVIMGDDSIVAHLAYSVRHCGIVGHLRKISQFLLLYNVRFHPIQVQSLLGNQRLKKILTDKVQINKTLQS